MTGIQRDTDAEKIKEVLERIQLNARRTIGLAHNEMRERSRQAVVDWMNSWEADWDLACCWHVSDQLRREQRGYDEVWLQRHLSAYFKKLIIRVFSHMPTKKRPHIARFIALEYSENVGWHAHGVMATPAHMARDEFIAAMRELWLEHAGWNCAENFKQHMCWFEPITGNYQHYTLKQAINLHDDAQQKFRGFIDLENTRRP